MTFVTELAQSLRRLITSPTSELTRAQLSLRYAIDLTRHCARALKHDRAGEMAAALTYRTIFSLIPVIVMALLVFRAFGGFEQVGHDLQDKIYNYFGLTALALPDGQSQSDVQLRARIDQIVTDLSEHVSQTSFGSIGAVGMVVLIWAALALAVTVERCFNRIYNCPTGRAWHHRITIYWAVITLGPVLVMVSVYLAGKATSMLAGVSVLGPLFSWLSGFTALLASWLLLFLLYELMPNTPVQRRAALIGSFVAAVLWEVGKWGFSLYVTKTLPYSRLYGALGLVPLFLLWLYVAWVIVLFGLELTYTLQAMQGRRFKYDRAQPETDQTGDPQWLLPIIAQIGRAFTEGGAIGRQALAEKLRLPVRAVAELGGKLIEAGLVHVVQMPGEQDTCFTLALPPEKIPVKRVLDLGHSMTMRAERNRSQPGWAYLEMLSQAQEAAAADATLATVLSEEPDNAPAG